MNKKIKDKPKNLSEALEWRYHQELIPYMGGTDLMIDHHEDRQYLFLGDLEELKYFRVDGQGVHIGAGMTYAALLELNECPKMLRQAMSQIASPAIRNVGTLGGNICNASPAGDSLPVLLLHDSELTLMSRDSERAVKLEDFIVSRKKIDLLDNELLVGMTMKPQSYNHFYYHKIGSRKAMSISKVAFAAAATITGDVMENFGIGLASMYKTPLRFRDIEEEYQAMTIDELIANQSKIVEAYAQRLQPIDDMRSTASYRKNVVLRLIRDFINSIAQKGMEKTV